MMNDQLTRDERIRLEALAQANGRFAMQNVPGHMFWNVVRHFETYITKGEMPKFTAEGVVEHKEERRQ